MRRGGGRGRGAVAASWAASALLHGGMAVATYVGAGEFGARAGEGEGVQLRWAAADVALPAREVKPPAPAPEETPEQQEKREREWTLGVDASDAETATWVGVAPEWAGDAIGRISDVEQGAFALPEGVSDSMTGSAGGAAAEESAPGMMGAHALGGAGERAGAREARESESVEEARAAAGKIEEQKKAQSAPVRGEREEGGESARGVREGLEESKKDEGGEDVETREAREATRVEGVTEEESRGTLREPSVEREERVRESKEGAEEAERESLEVSRPEQAPRTGGVRGQGGEGGGLVVESLEGQVSDKESEATALKDRVKVTPGQPVAAKGLEIKTRRPVFSRYVRVMAAPRNAVVRVRFTREGRVASAEMVRSSGWDDVDRPLLDAVYQWTASGKRLLELPETREGEKPATVSMVFEIVLR